MGVATKSHRSGRGSGDAGPTRGGLALKLLLGVIGAVLLVGIVGYAVYVLKQSGPTGGPLAPPAASTATSGDGVSVGRDHAAATVDIYEDLQCVACRTYQLQSAATLDTLIDSGAARVVFHPVALLDSLSSTGYSTRAAAASGCAAQAGVFRRYLALLFANQPAEHSAGLSNDQLIGLGRQVQAGSGFAECVNDGTYTHWVTQVTGAARDAGISGLPVVEVDGQRIGNTSAALIQAVQATRR